MSAQNNEIRLRMATPKDAEALLGIYTYYVEHTAITYEYTVPTVEEFSERIRKTLEVYPYLIAELKGKIVGYAYIGRFRPRKAYDWSVETSIYVDKDCKGLGVGRKLYGKLEELAAKQNVLNMNACISCAEVEDEYQTNDSVHFHERMGYSMVGIFHKSGYKFNRWYDMCWMEKMLGEHTSDAKPLLKVTEIETGL